jgi:hypothetical protein
MKQRLCDMLNDLRYYDDILREYLNLIEYFIKIKNGHLYLSRNLENKIINKILKRTYKTTCLAGKNL